MREMGEQNQRKNEAKWCQRMKEKLGSVGFQ